MDRPFVFVIMSFGAEFGDVYELGIRPACEAAGVDCQRVDEQFFLESILERIYGQIERADIVIAELTGAFIRAAELIRYDLGLCACPPMPGDPRHKKLLIRNERKSLRGRAAEAQRLGG